MLRRAKRGLAATVTTSRLAINNVVTEHGLWFRRNIAGLRLPLLSQLLHHYGVAAMNCASGCCNCVRGAMTVTVARACGLGLSLARIESVAQLGGVSTRKFSFTNAKLGNDLKSSCIEG